MTTVSVAPGPAAADRRARRRTVFGGKTVYGAAVGILMMETGFPRPPGDMGNATTWPFPVLYKVVRGITIHTVHSKPESEVLAAFTDAARELVEAGADGVAVCCGMTSLYQKELAQALQVLVVTSSLLQVRLVERLLPPGRRVGILTISTDLLKPKHLAAAGVAPDTPVVGCEPEDEFIQMRLRADRSMDVAAAERNILDAGRALVGRHPEVGAVVVECTMMPPYSRALRDAVGLPVFDVYSLVSWFHAGLAPRAFGPPGGAEGGPD